MQLDLWIPKALMQDSEVRVRARIFIAASWLLAGLILVAAAVRWSAAPMSHATMAAIGLAVLILLISPSILRRTGRLALTGLILPTVLLVMALAIAHQNGGIQAPVIIAIPLVPVTAAYFCGWRAGLIYMLAVFAALSQLLLQYLDGSTAPPPFETAEQLWLVRAVVTACVVAFLVSIAGLYDLQRRRATQELVASEARYRLAAAAGKELAFQWDARNGFHFSQPPSDLFPGLNLHEVPHKRRGLEKVLTAEQLHGFERAWSQAVAVSADFSHSIAIHADGQMQGVMHLLASPQTGAPHGRYHGVLRRLDPGLTIGDQDLRILPELLAGLRQEHAVVRQTLHMQESAQGDPALATMLRGSAQEALQRATEMLDRTHELLQPTPRGAVATVERFGLRRLLTQVLEQLRLQGRIHVQWQDDLPLDSEMHGQIQTLSQALTIVIRDAAQQCVGPVRLHSEACGANLRLRISTQADEALAHHRAEPGPSRTALRALQRQQAHQILRLHGGDLRLPVHQDPAPTEIVLPYRPIELAETALDSAVPVLTTAGADGKPLS